MTTDEPATQTSDGRPAAGHPPIPQYEIRVTGHLGPRWATWFDGMDLADSDDGTTIISGPVVDQAALHGLLQKLRDLGVPLVSLIELAHDTPTDGPTGPTPEGTPT